jgi:hypothetical protein
LKLLKENGYVFSNTYHRVGLVIKVSGSKCLVLFGSSVFGSDKKICDAGTLDTMPSCFGDSESHCPNEKSCGYKNPCTKFKESPIKVVEKMYAGAIHAPERVRDATSVRSVME